jgi:hypothetical protein
LPLGEQYFQSGEPFRSGSASYPASAPARKRRRKAMWIVKNLPGWERALRVGAGIAMAAGGLLVWPGQVAGVGLAACGAVAALTGFVGFCPMCALAGRKLAPKDRT